MVALSHLPPDQKFYLNSRLKFLENKIVHVERSTVEISGELFRDDASYHTGADLADVAEEYVALGAGLAKPWEPLLSQGITLISA